MQKPSVCLSWPGKGALRASVPASLTVVRSGDPRARLVHGDNLDALRALGSRLPESVTLAYLDPPFLTGRLHERVTRVRDAATGKVHRTRSAAFDDRWDGIGHYLEELAPRLVSVRELLASHGSVVLHVDSKTSHYAKVLCDEIFGQRAFASEIVWRYRRWPSKTPNFQRLHDVLLRYVKDPDVRPRFRQLYEPLAASTLATWGKKKQRAIVDDDGRRTRSSKTEEATPGTPLGDVWDIGIVAPVARERTGYPTQKPELLIQRLVEALTDPGELVLDPYVGSGTTPAVCARLGRSVVGIDSNPEAIEITRRRLAAASVEPTEERVTLRPAVRAATRRRASRDAA